jgi:protein TonB
MEKIAATLTLFIVSLSGICQDTLMIYYDSAWKETSPEKSVYYRKKFRDANKWGIIDFYKSGNIQMKGSFLDDSCKIQQGEFVYFDEKGNYTKLSTYKEGKYDGKMIFYNREGKIAREGVYKMGKYDGDWIGYFPSGKIAGKAHYEEDKQISGEFYNEDGTINRNIHEFEKESEFPGTAGALGRYLSSVLRYPDKAVRNNIQGTVIVQFVVDEKGKVTDIRILNHVDELLEREAGRVVREMPLWRPAIQGGRYVKSYKKLPIVFKLQG